MGRALREKIFVSYAHEDRGWLDEFLRMLEPAIQSEILDVWSDERIRAGDEWRDEIERALGEATVALLLVTRDFLASDFIARHELPEILAGAHHRGLSVHWVPISAALHQVTPLAHIQASVVDPEHPLDSLPESERARAIRDICWDICSKLGQVSRVNPDERDALRASVDRILPAHVEIEEAIGSGHYSIVYRARRNDAPVAVKVLVDSPLHERASTDVEDHARRALALKHPAFVDIHDILLEDRPHCILMEYVDAETLAHHLEHQGPLPVDVAVDVVRQLCEALAEAHEHGLVYGIMKPSDVFLHDGSRPRISAFGFWSYLAKDDALAGNFLLNKEAVSYTAPEHYHGWPISTKTDQYSLGLLALEMLDGRRPVSVRCPADFEAKRHFFEAPLAAAGPWSTRHSALARILAKMLDPRPYKRWSSLAAVTRALGALEGEAVAVAKGTYLSSVQGRDGFFAAFYERLFAARPALRERFAGRDMPAQRRMLDLALQALLNFRGEPVVEPTVLSAIAERHAALGLRPADFEHFRAALLETLEAEAGLDRPAVAAWASTIRPGLEYMTGRCCDGVEADGLDPGARAAGG